MTRESKISPNICFIWSNQISCRWACFNNLLAEIFTKEILSYLPQTDSKPLFSIVIATLSLVCFLWRIHLKNSDTTTNLMTRITVEMMATVRCLATVVLVTQDKRLLKQGSHFSEVTKFQYFSRISQVFRSKFPGMCLIFFHFQVVLKQKPANL